MPQRVNKRTTIICYRDTPAHVPKTKTKLREKIAMITTGRFSSISIRRVCYSWSGLPSRRIRPDASLWLSSLSTRDNSPLLKRCPREPRKFYQFAAIPHKEKAVHRLVRAQGRYGLRFKLRRDRPKVCSRKSTRNQ